MKKICCVICGKYRENWKKSIVLFAVSTENLKILKYHTFGKTISSFNYLH